MRIIVNADDFGRHEKINEAVEKAFHEGCLRSATLMPGGKAFNHGVEVAKRNLDLGVGIHLTLVNGFPILPPEEIPSLVAENGAFYDDYGAFMKRYATGKIRLEEVRAELAAQIAKVQGTGLELTHLDSHQHLHHLPGILGIVLKLASFANIKRLRFSRGRLAEDLFRGHILGRVGLSSLARIGAQMAKRKGFAMPDHFAGIVAGEAVTEKYLFRLFEHLGKGTTEIMLHPGTDNAVLQSECRWEHDFEAELRAVTSARVLKTMKTRGIEAVSFRSL